MLRIEGLASGFNTSELIQQMMRAERMPLDRLVQKKIWTEWQRDAYRDVNQMLTDFRSSAENMRLQSTFNSYIATPTDSGIVTASATANAVPGQYQVEVVQTAQVARLSSVHQITDQNGAAVTGSTNVWEAAELSAEQTFTIENNGKSATITVTEGDTFNSLARKMERAVDDSTEESLGIRASFDSITGKFFISSRDMGGDQQVVLKDEAGEDFVKQFVIGLDTGAGTGQYGFNQEIEYTTDNGQHVFTTSGQSGQVIFEGSLIDDLHTNSVTVHGINLNLQGTGTTTVQIGTDPDHVYETIKGFVDDYNELLGNLRELVNEPRHRSFPPLTDDQKLLMSDREIEKWEEQAMSGLLRNDVLLTRFMNEIRSSLYEPVQGIPDGQINQLSQLGITTGDFRLGGQLFVDENKLRSVIAENPDEVMNLFTNRAADDVSGSAAYQQTGLGHRLYADVNDSLSRLIDQAGRPGVTLGDQSLIGRNLKQIDEQITRQETRLDRIEQRYWRQFTAMEQALNQLNSQHNFLMQQLLGGL